MIPILAQFGASLCYTLALQGPLTNIPIPSESDPSHP